MRRDWTDLDRAACDHLRGRGYKLDPITTHGETRLHVTRALWPENGLSDSDWDAIERLAEVIGAIEVWGGENLSVDKPIERAMNGGLEL